MMKKDILSIACKIFGIYFLVRAIESSQFVGTSLMYLIDTLRQRASGGGFMIVSFLVPFLIYIYAAFYFIRRSDAIADRLCGANTSGSIQGAFDKDTLQEVLFSAIGVFIIANALASLIHAFTMLLGQNYSRESISQLTKLPAYMFKVEPIDLTWPIIRFIANSTIGLYLIFSSNKLVILLKKLQHNYSNRSK